MLIKKYNIPFFFCLIFLISIIIYFPALNSYFFQDDWYSLSISKAANLTEILNFFLPNKNVVYYRPLGMQFPFFLLQVIFGLNPLPFKIIALSVHLLNVLLVYRLFKKLIKSESVSLLSAFLYSTSAVHYIPFFWSATFAFILGITFSLLTFLFFIEQKYLRSFLFFILGFLTFEIIAVLPFILLSYKITNKVNQGFKVIVPYILTSVLYAFFRVNFLPPPEIPEYGISLNQQTLMNLKYYFLWAFNWPEEMKNQFLSFITVNPLFIKDFSFYYYSFVVSFFINIFFLVLLPAVFTVLGKIKIDLRNIIFALIWSLTSILPVLFFPLHTFPYYLPLSFLGILFLLLPPFYQYVSYLSKRLAFISWLLPGIVIANWLWSVFVLIDFNAKVHWAPRRSNLSRQFMEKATNEYNPSDSVAVFLIKPDAENRFALNNQDALRVFFNNPRLKTVYTDENIPGYRL